VTDDVTLHETPGTESGRQFVDDLMVEFYLEVLIRAFSQVPLCRQCAEDPLPKPPTQPDATEEAPDDWHF
jgi:hypothetical protein